MSYENIPKNLTEKAVLTRGGRPDYITLSTDPAPIPTADESGAIWEHSDTGDRYRWTSTVWVLVATAGSSVANVRDYWLSVSRGDIAGSAMTGKVIVNPLATNTELDLWGGSADMVYPVGAETWEIVSSDVNDTSAGTGARTVLVNYLDTDYVQQSIIVSLNGTTPVTLNTDHYRPDGAIVLTCGSGQVNAGDITIRVSGAGNPRQYIMAGICGSQDCHYTVPAGKTAYFLQTYGWFPKNEDGYQVSKFMFFGSNTWLTSAKVPVYQQGYNINVLARVALPEKTDLRFTVFSTNPNIEATAIIELITVDN